MCSLHNGEGQFFCLYSLESAEFLFYTTRNHFVFSILYIKAYCVYSTI